MAMYYTEAQQESTSVNTLLEYGVGFQSAIRNRWPGATLTVLDAHSLMRMHCIA